MKSLPDHHTAHRIAALRVMQGLPFSIPPNHTIYRQSDFEKSKVWRCVMVAAFVVIVTNVLSPAPQTADAPVIATRAMV